MCKFEGCKVLRKGEKHQALVCPQLFGSQAEDPGVVSESLLDDPTITSELLENSWMMLANMPEMGASTLWRICSAVLLDDLIVTQSTDMALQGEAVVLQGTQHKPPISLELAGCMMEPDQTLLDLGQFDAI